MGYSNNGFRCDIRVPLKSKFEQSISLCFTGDVMPVGAENKVVVSALRRVADYIESREHEELPVVAPTPEAQ